MNAQEQLSAFIDGESEAASEPLVFAHLVECARCREFFRDAQAMHAEIRRVPPLRAPAGLDERILGAEAQQPIDRHTPLQMSLRALRARVSVPMPIAAAVVILLIAASVSFFRATGRIPFVAPVPTREVVYVMTLPAVEIEAAIPTPHSAIH